MWSSMKTVISWLETKLDVRVCTYPPRDMPRDFAVVQRVAGPMSYPHDSPRYTIQVWTDSDEGGEQVMLALSRVLPTLADADPRINAVDSEPEVTQLGHVETGHFVWQMSFQMHVNIRE